MSAVRNFSLTRFGSPGIGSQSLGVPTAAYPGRVATNSDLIVAVDRQQTSLLLALSSTATSMTVLDPSMIVAYSLLSIDDEIVKTTGVPAGNVVPISRGFDGTTPGAHQAGAIVAGLIDAFHHNGLVAEIEAIEQALGPNLSRVPVGPFVLSSAYDFSPQAPGGNLVVGNNSITLTPVPAGVNGSDQFHYLYISGGTGAPEAALITGGSAVAGAPSGSLIVNCANAHTGAWTIRTATSGMQEAVNSLGPTGGQVTVPPGNWNVYAPTTVTAGGVWIKGTGIGNTNVADSNPTGNTFVFTGLNNYCRISDLTITGSGKTAGWAILRTGGGGIFSIYNLYIRTTYQGIQLNASTLVYVDQVLFSELTGGDCILVTGNGNEQILSRIFGDRTTVSGAGLNIQQTGGLWGRDLDFIHNTQGILIDPGSGQMVNYLFFEQVSVDTCTNGIVIQPGSTGSVTSARFTDCWASSCSLNGVEITNSSGATNTFDVRFLGLRAFANGHNGVHVNRTKNVSIENSSFSGNSAAASGTYADILVDEAISYFNFSGNRFNVAPGGGNQSYNIQIGAVAADFYQISHNSFSAGTAGTLQNGATGTHGIVIDNLGYNPVGQSSITVGASPFTYTAGSSPETVYIQGGTLSQVNLAARTIANAAPPAGQSIVVPLAPNQQLGVTYTVAPTMFRDVG